MKTYPFSALFSRMKYITRWCLMRSTRPESLSEHTADTAMLAHTLCLIGRHCTGTGAALRPEVVATAAIYHDAPEILTGDMPTPVKYKNDALRTAYKAVEHESARVMASLQPEELQAETQVWLTGSMLNDAPFIAMRAVRIAIAARFLLFFLLDTSSHSVSIIVGTPHDFGEVYAHKNQQRRSDND